MESAARCEGADRSCRSSITRSVRPDCRAPTSPLMAQSGLNEVMSRRPLMTHNGQPFRVSSCVTRVSPRSEFNGAKLGAVAARRLVSIQHGQPSAGFPRPNRTVANARRLVVRQSIPCRKHLLPHRALWTGLGMRTNRFLRLRHLWRERKGRELNRGAS
jgi:hypothetical protein